jgi:hypothetical protein
MTTRTLGSGHSSVVIAARIIDIPGLLAVIELRNTFLRRRTNGRPASDLGFALVSSCRFVVIYRLGVCLTSALIMLLGCYGIARLGIICIQKIH